MSQQDVFRFLHVRPPTGDTHVACLAPPASALDPVVEALDRFAANVNVPASAGPEVARWVRENADFTLPHFTALLGSRTDLETAYANADAAGLRDAVDGAQENVRTTLRSHREPVLRDLLALSLGPSRYREERAELLFVARTTTLLDVWDDDDALVAAARSLPSLRLCLPSAVLRRLAPPPSTSPDEPGTSSSPQGTLDKNRRRYQRLLGGYEELMAMNGSARSRGRAYQVELSHVARGALQTLTPTVKSKSADEDVRTEALGGLRNALLSAQKDTLKRFDAESERDVLAPVVRERDLKERRVLATAEKELGLDIRNLPLEQAIRHFEDALPQAHRNYVVAARQLKEL